MKKLILLLLFIPLVSCNDSKKIKNTSVVSQTSESKKKYKKLKEKDFSRISLVTSTMVLSYRDKAIKGDCDYFTRVLYMGSEFQKGEWNYIDKTYTSKVLFGDEKPRFLIKEISIKLDINIFIYLYSDIYCALKNENYEIARQLINSALDIYNSTNILGYYDVYDLKPINNYMEAISSLKSIIPVDLDIQLAD